MRQIANLVQNKVLRVFIVGIFLACWVIIIPWIGPDNCVYRLVSYISQGIIFLASSIFTIILWWKLRRRDADLFTSIFLFLLAVSYIIFAFSEVYPVLDRMSTAIDWLLTLFLAHSIIQRGFMYNRGDFHRNHD